MSELKIGAFKCLCPWPAATAQFYQDAFDARADGIDVMLGQQRIVFAQGRKIDGAYPPSNATSFQHLAIVVSDMALAMSKLGSVAAWTPISRAGPEHLPQSSGGVTAFKFRDPDGHPLELLAFPSDALPPRWRNRAGLFMGIDHTAITVANTNRSIVFYKEMGFEVSSQSLNRGDKQARMDAVANPIAEVTGLTPLGGVPPHLELLCYCAPGSLAQPVADDEALATRIIFEGAGSSRTGVDPDGHRFEFNQSPQRPETDRPA